MCEKLFNPHLLHLSKQHHHQLQFSIQEPRGHPSCLPFFHPSITNLFVNPVVSFKPHSEISLIKQETIAFLYHFNRLLPISPAPILTLPIPTLKPTFQKKLNVNQFATLQLKRLLPVAKFMNAYLLWPSKLIRTQPLPNFLTSFLFHLALEHRRC